MEGEGVEGVGSTTESPAVTDPQPQTPQDPGQAPTPPGNQPQHQPHVPYERFQQVIRQLQEYRPMVAQVPQLQQQLKDATDRLAKFEQTQQRGTTTPEEAEQFRQAASALERIVMSNPEVLDRMLSAHPKFKLLSEHADRLIQGQGSVQQLQQAQGQALLRQATTHINGLAKEAGLPQDPAYLQRLVRLVAAEAQQLEGGNQRFSQGDLSVLDEAFKALQGNFLTHMQRAGTAGLLKTKQATQQLPPAPRGGSAAGPPGLAKFDPSKPNAVGSRFDELRKVAAGMLADSDKE